MATMRGKEGNVLHLLSNLIELDFDAVEAYEAAIDRLEDPASRERMTEFKRDHLRHIDDLSAIMSSLGGEPPRGGDFKRVLTRGKVVIAEIVGDRGVLMAMKSNENDTNTAYERASARSDLPVDLLTIMNRNLSDERRHRAWIDQRLSQLGTAEHANPRPL